MMAFRKIKVFFRNHKLWIILAIVMIILTVLAFVALGSLESFFQTQVLATLPLEALKMILYSAVGAWFFVMMYSRGMFMFDKTGKNVIKAKDVQVSFDDVIGLGEAKREALEVVHLISDRARIKRIGGKMIHGILMIGPPGCGKTYLAKAIAHEANIPFFSLSGSDFVEVFVGVGASRVRKLFQKARDAAYTSGSSIIFIDELDVIGRGRTFNAFGGSEETNSTQNQLLVEMDGLQKHEDGDVIVIGATNAGEEILDKALLRPGRFDRKIYVGKPNLEEREAMFAYYFKQVKVSPAVSVQRLARKAVGKSPAEIENIVKEAALISIRQKNEFITLKDLSDAMDRVDLGMIHRLSMTKHEKEATAYHESGHLMVLYRLHPTDDVFKASIIPRGGALGVVHHSPREELHTMSRDQMLANIKVALAGYVAEKIKYGNTTSGVASDFQNAMQTAHAMVWRLGMGSNGYVGDYASIPEQHMAEEMKKKLNDEVQALLQECMKEVETFLRKEWNILEVFAQTLIEKEELDYDEIDALFKQHGIKQSMAQERTELV